MNKLFTKIGAITLGVALAAGAGVALSMVAKDVTGVEAAEYTELSCDFTKKTTSHSNYNDDGWDYDDNFFVYSGANNNGGWDYVKLGGKSDYMADYNPAYVKSKTATENSITKVVITTIANTNKNKNAMGASLKVYVASDSAFTSVIDTIDYGTFDHKTASVTTIIPSTGTSWASGSYFKAEWTCTNTSTTNGIVWVSKIELKYDVEVLTPDTIVVEGDTSPLQIGSSVQLTSTATKSGSSTGVNQNVTWSSLDETKAIVDENGVVTGVGNGTATIRATSEADNTVHGDLQLTVFGAKTDDLAFVLMPDNFGTAYGDNYTEIGQIYTHYKQIMKNDGAIQVQATNGLLENVTKFAYDIETIEFTVNSGSTGENYVVSVSADGVNYTTLSVSEYAINKLVYTPAAGNYYFRLQAGSKTLKLDEVLVGFGNVAETDMIAVAKSMNDILDEECGGSSDTSPITEEKWAEIKGVFTAASEDARTALINVGQTGSYHEVNKFLSRYDYIVSYGRENFLSRTAPSAISIANNVEMNNTSLALIIIVTSVAVISTAAIVTLIVIRKKRFN